MYFSGHAVSKWLQNTDIHQGRSMSWKIHLAALSVAIILILIIANIPGHSPTGNAPVSNLSIRIANASWGMNCKNIPNNVPANSNPFKSDGSNSGAYNNVQNVVSRLCDGKVSCNGAANTTTLGADPFPGCSKDLKIEYRCFSYDRPWSVDVDQEQNFTIDCKEHYPS
jgi:hypothetical protein